MRGDSIVVEAHHVQAASGIAEVVLPPKVLVPSLWPTYNEKKFAEMCNAHAIGVRREHLTLSTTKGEWPGIMKVAEQLGFDTFLHLEVDGMGRSRLGPQAYSVSRTTTASISHPCPTRVTV